MAARRPKHCGRLRWPKLMMRTGAPLYRNSAWLAVLLAGLTLCSPARSEGDEPWYDVEVIVFAQAGGPYRNTEDWPIDPLSPTWRTDLQSTDFPLSSVSGDDPAPAAAPQPYLLLGPENLHLNQEYQRLEQAPQYHTLLHMAWRQPGLSRDQALAMPIHVNRSDLAGTATPGDMEKPEPKEASASVAVTEVAPGGEEPEVPVLEGTIRLVLSRYLHLEVDLTYHEADEVGPGDANQPAEHVWMEEVPDESRPGTEKSGGHRLFRLQEARRMRSREIHYLDHPMFGVIAVATPSEPPLQPLEEHPLPPQTGQQPTGRVP